MTIRREPSSFERDMLARMAAGWKCESCGAEHGKPHPAAPSTRVFLRVVDGQACCQLCDSDAEDEHARA